ncbi:hypothetical protein FKW15_04070 [Acetobacter sp. DmW_125133]|uniref:Uncharacterized protein n=2 Tax=Acetobacter TaxID=434 RepID=A0AAN1UA90_9PROT|nr:hypothetical protein CBI36_06050 [Acetobacter oryzifermentans]ATI13318.1 hypothetical protein CPF11_01755 [Acetobacter pomorum]AXC27704.1 hypothetical protein DS739_05915 [Acetobacter sp. JWB]KAA8396969.1 hypothetical protein FKW19_07070 [Acetobacter sp. DmW_125128]KAA8399411.1 hypothetical protein FKW20_04125 [Acetobacter sp. DmW_125127]KAA8400689.1 hypothetical protein FKW22_00525 [Acetobacter sp. DmW_125124]KAA8405897.1 hypothetical protein FKW24_08670 [Acetobacter sp. DmW_125134]KAA84
MVSCPHPFYVHGFITALSCSGHFGIKKQSCIKKVCFLSEGRIVFSEWALCKATHKLLPNERPPCCFNF